MLIAHLYIFFVGIYVQMFYSFLNGLLVLLLLNCKRFLYSGYKPLIRYMTDKYFPPVCGLPFYFLVVFFERKAERQRIDAFELWCWRRLLRVP